jgi:hypothetical protein
MSNPIQVLRTEGAVIAQAPWSFALCLFVIGGIMFLILRSLKAQEVADLNSRLTLRNDEIADYRRKLDGRSPMEAKDFIEALEVEAVVEADAAVVADTPPPVASVTTRPRPVRHRLPQPEGERVFISEAEFSDAMSRTAGLTGLQQSALLEGIVGKWRTLETELLDVRQSSTGLLAFIRDRGELVGAKFSDDWSGQLAALPIGSILTIKGQIKGLASGVRLDHCEIVSSSAAPVEQPPA